jgi:hypothetical protein
MHRPPYASAPHRRGCDADDVVRVASSQQLPARGAAPAAPAAPAPNKLVPLATTRQANPDAYYGQR